MSGLNPRYQEGMYRSNRLQVQVFGSVLSRVTGYHVLCFPQSLQSIWGVFSNDQGPLINVYLFPIKQRNLRRQTPNKKKNQQISQKLEATSKLKAPNGRHEASSVVYWGPTTGATVQNSAAWAKLLPGFVHSRTKNFFGAALAPSAEQLRETESCLRSWKSLS